MYERFTGRKMCYGAKELGRRIDQCTIIFDLDQVHLGHLYKPGMDVFCDILKMFEDNYPECLKMNYVINSPKFFPVAFKIIRPFLSERTVGKVKLYGRDYKQHLLKAIDADQLPVFLGGTMVDSNKDPKCREMICFGGEVPKSYYMKLDSQLASQNMSSVIVERASSYRVDVDVDVPGSVVRWRFFTENNDISYGVYHKKLGQGRQKVEEMDELVQSIRVNCHIVPEDGMITCSHPGTYVLRFDNTYSWVKQKKVFYTIEVIPPATIRHSQSEASFDSLPDEDQVYCSQTDSRVEVVATNTDTTPQ